MKILLTSLNAKFVHTSLSVYSLKAFAKEYKENIDITEFTINNSLDHCLKIIAQKSPDIIGFSTYIWNINETLSLISNLKKILPNTKIILGGPEVSYNPKQYLDYADFIVSGEGEKPFYELLQYFDNKLKLEQIGGICYKQGNEIIENNTSINIPLSDIPFPYEDIKSFENKIIYYESSRGCPYSCSYCLSSIENGVRFLSEDRVKSDLTIFLENKPKQVKFVDRTFNANIKHTMTIWQFLIENDNGVTNFHFELSANTITDEMIELLKTARVGLFQFEIGVQTTNETTLKEIDRKLSNEQIFNAVRKILNLKNIHVHVDLIAGLPYEDFKSFTNSFNETYELNADMLQLGFLKLLHGSKLRVDSDKYGIIFRDYAPYEVLKTKDISYLELETLKGVEEMVDTYYNSGKYKNTLNYAKTLFQSPFDMYLKLFEHIENSKELLASVSKASFRSLIYDVTKNDFVKDILRYDLFSLENINSMPESLQGQKVNINRESSEKIYNDENLFKAHLDNRITKKQIIRNSRIEKFDFDIIEYLETNTIKKEETFILFDYFGFLVPTKLDKKDINYDTIWKS